MQETTVNTQGIAPPAKDFHVYTEADGFLCAALSSPEMLRARLGELMYGYVKPQIGDNWLAAGAVAHEFLDRLARPGFLDDPTAVPEPADHVAMHRIRLWAMLVLLGLVPEARKAVAATYSDPAIPEHRRAAAQLLLSQCEEWARSDLHSSFSHIPVNQLAQASVVTTIVGRVDAMTTILATGLLPRKG